MRELARFAVKPNVGVLVWLTPRLVEVLGLMQLVSPINLIHILRLIRVYMLAPKQTGDPVAKALPE